MSFRILFFTTSLGKGGAESHLLRLARSLVDLPEPVAVDIAVLYPGEYASQLPSEVQLHVLGKAGQSVTMGLVQAIGPLQRLVRDLRPDVVCAVMDLPALFAREALRRIPETPAFVASVQNPPQLRFELDRPSLSAAAKVYGFLQLAATRRMYRRADAIIAISDGVREDVMRLAPDVAQKARVIYNAGVDATVMTRAGRPVPEEVPLPSPLVVACGRLVHQKGFDVLIDAFGTVRERIEGATLWILGQGPLREALENQAAALGLSDAVVFKGFQDNPFAYMAAADVFVLSSRFEGFGNVVAEAMASGTAVVSTDCPYGPGEIIEDGQTGLLVPTENAEALSGALVRALSDAELRTRLAADGYVRSQSFTAAVSAREHLNLFRDVTGQRSGSQ